MTSPAPGTFGRDQNRHYKTQEEFLFAIAGALRVEYRAITDAGFILQIDDPGMAENWDAMDPSVTIGEYRAYARLCIEALNRALEGIPEDRVRYHMCWGSWHGPHLTDVPLRDIVDLLLTIRAGAYSLEAGNVRHEHEWKVWRDVKLPEGKVLIPGVVSHATNVVEHPEWSRIGSSSTRSSLAVRTSWRSPTVASAAATSLAGLGQAPGARRRRGAGFQAALAVESMMNAQRRKKKYVGPPLVAETVNNMSMVGLALVVVLMVTAGTVSHAQVTAASTGFKLLDAVIFYGTPPTQGYAADVLREMRQFAQRANAYRPRPRPPKLGSEMAMVYAAREGYEKKLVAAASAAGAERLAQQYVDELRPCYEWEGFHDCPEREAKFAEQYVAKNPNSPFAEFLPLLIAHRWLCAAEGYDMEERPEDAARARLAAAAPLATALTSRSLLIRTAAQEQKARGRCRGVAA